MNNTKTDSAKQKLEALVGEIETSEEKKVYMDESEDDKALKSWESSLQTSLQSEGETMFIIKESNFGDILPRLECLTEDMNTELLLGKARVHVTGEDEYLVRKAVGYLENAGFIVSFRETGK